MTSQLYPCSTAARGLAAKLRPKDGNAKHGLYGVGEVSRILPRQIRPNQLQLELRTVPSMTTHTHGDLRADRLKGQSAPPDLSTSRGSLQILCNLKSAMTCV